MTTLYRPVLIESVEQAEALPEGTIALLPFGHRTKIAGGWWETPTGGGLDESRAVVGAQALVPIEAEEEWTAMGSDNGEPWIAHVGHDGIDGSREEAQQYVDRFGGFIAHRTRTPWEEA